jgi:hypothetical protein
MLIFYSWVYNYLYSIHKDLFQLVFKISSTKFLFHGPRAGTRNLLHVGKNYFFYPWSSGNNLFHD